MREQEYDLVGVDGNAFSVMAYVRKAMKEQGFSKSEIDDYVKEAMSSDYNNLLVESMKYLDLCNEKMWFGSYDEDDDDDCDEEDDCAC